MIVSDSPSLACRVMSDCSNNYYGLLTDAEGMQIQPGFPLLLWWW
jgi:hypothetical protein